MIGQGFDFLHVIDFIEDTGEETYLITNSLWFVFFVGWDFIQKFAFPDMSLDVGAKMQLGLDFIQGSDFIHL